MPPPLGGDGFGGGDARGPMRSNGSSSSMDHTRAMGHAARKKAVPALLRCLELAVESCARPRRSHGTLWASARAAARDATRARSSDVAPRRHGGRSRHAATLSLSLVTDVSMETMGWIMAFERFTGQISTHTHSHLVGLRAETPARPSVTRSHVPFLQTRQQFYERRANCVACNKAITSISLSLAVVSLSLWACAGCRLHIYRLWG